MTIFHRNMVKLKKLLKLLQKITFFEHIYLKMILDRLMMLMMLVIIYTLSMYDIRTIIKIAQPSKVEFQFDRAIPKGI